MYGFLIIEMSLSICICGVCIWFLIIEAFYQFTLCQTHTKNKFVKNKIRTIVESIVLTHLIWLQHFEKLLLL
jgi:hypothetical protein